MYMACRKSNSTDINIEQSPMGLKPLAVIQRRPSYEINLHVCTNKVTYEYTDNHIHSVNHMESHAEADTHVYN